MPRHFAQKAAWETRYRNSFHEQSIMRSRLIILIILFILLTLGFAISRLVAFIQLFFEHSGVAITQQEIASAYAELGAQRRPQLIPKIIHQVFHDWRHQNRSLPSDWDDLRQTCINLHEDWEYVVCRNLLSIIV
jgi:mannosyltransferase OCH1-like enzyme